MSGLELGAPELNDRPTPRRALIEARRPRGYEALGVMDSHLETRDFFVGDRYSIADIALYAYTHVAPEGGYELDRFDSVLRWLDRVRGQPGHVALEAARP